MYLCSMASAYQEAATSLSNKQCKVRLAKVDCTVYRDICQTQGIKGYPTLKLFKKGAEPQQYTGARSTESFVEYALNAMKEGATAPAGGDKVQYLNIIY